MTSAQKREKRKQEDQFVESQRGAVHKFFLVSSNAEINKIRDRNKIALLMKILYIKN